MCPFRNTVVSQEECLAIKWRQRPEYFDNSKLHSLTCVVSCQVCFVSQAARAENVLFVPMQIHRTPPARKDRHTFSMPLHSHVADKKPLPLRLRMFRRPPISVGATSSSHPLFFIVSFWIWHLLHIFCNCYCAIPICCSFTC